MHRTDRTNPERAIPRPTAASHTLLAVLLLLTVVPGAAACAVVESDHALRTTLRDTPRRDEPRELSQRAVATLAAALKHAASQATVAIPVPLPWLSSGHEPVAATSFNGRSVVATERVRLALLNLPPPMRA